MQTQEHTKQVSARQVATQRCVYCAEKALSVTVTHNGSLSLACVACRSCGHEVVVAVKDGVKLAKCPKCHGVATPAYGKRSDQSPFVAFACDRCLWVASDAFMRTAAIAFGLLTD